MVLSALRLPNYPSAETRQKLAPSQLASLYQTIASTLEVVVSLPAEKRDATSSGNYISTYAASAAFRSLQNIIWKEEKRNPSSQETLIEKLGLTLAERLAGTLELQALLDLAIAHGRTHSGRMQKIFAAASQSNRSLSQDAATEIVPSFTFLLKQQTPTSQGLYAQRKVAECICCFLRAAKTSPSLVRPFCHDTDFVIALATLYDTGMTSIASSYGGLPALAAGISGQTREADDWERIWIETKVALIDAFHIILCRLLEDLASQEGAQLAEQAERTFGLVFALLEIPSSAPSSNDTPPTPFLNQSLLTDYQHSYSLSKALDSALKHAKEKDARLDLLESTLQSLDRPQNDSKNPGALKILLRSSGMPFHKYHQSTPRPAVVSFSTVMDKGKEPAGPSTSIDGRDPDVDIKVTQILDILPDTSPSYARSLLAHHRYEHNPEKVIEALLEGTALTQEGLIKDEYPDGSDGPNNSTAYSSKGKERAIEQAGSYDVSERRNVFDDDDLDVNQLRVGKKVVGSEVLRDPSFVEEMKADILRRAEAISDDEEYEDPYFDSHGISSGPSASVGKKKAISAALGPDDLDDLDPPRIRVAGDGEDISDASDDDDEREEDSTPETIIEQAYLHDPKVFDRDAATRRSKERAQLKLQTGWADEQIEGWKVMLERTPGRKEKLAEKYAFTGNRKGPIEGPSAQDGRGRGRGRGRGGRGGRGGGGGGRGGRGRGGGDGDGNARERAWKDKNKASRGNHNRKRGHDKKMARAGAGIGPST